MAAAVQWGSSGGAQDDGPAQVPGQGLRLVTVTDEVEGAGATGVSPAWTLPPGNSHSPAMTLPAGRSANSTRPSASISTTAATSTT